MKIHYFSVPVLFGANGKIEKFFDSLYASGRLGIPLSGLLIIGY